MPLAAEALARERAISSAELSARVHFLQLLIVFSQPVDELAEIVNPLLLALRTGYPSARCVFMKT
jgi:hypothetical protein